ncbi:McrB family protein [Paraburkholderia agricolaris]|uniref:McrB family protein n=1 Tax=Paraburkholderia agricolaris TaxID=2152888 RepID=UPI001292BB22|nr:restriction endonuclease [Paraburkholderia agricolaris]
MPNLLADTGALRASLETVLAGPAKTPGTNKWYAELKSFLTETRGADEQKLRDRSFLRRLWDENPVSAVGNGRVKIAPALESDEFVDWFAQNASIALPADPLQAEAALTTLYSELVLRLGKLCDRIPRLKLNRVLCALYPQYFTTVADVGKLLYLNREMGGSQKDHPVHAHVTVRRRIDEILGSVSTSDPLEEVRRMCLPWMLYERLTTEQITDVQGPVEATPNQLSPLPAALRRKGLTAMKGGYQTLLGFLPALDDGVTREEFGDLVRQANPELAPQSIGPSINVVMREFDLCKREGDVYRLSARGINLLESQDPHELADHLLTRVLGVDHVIRALSEGPKSKTELVPLLQKVNPGWTTEFAPTALLGWLTSIGATTAKAARYELTELGQRWSEMVTWEPEFLPKPAATAEELKATVDEQVKLLPWQTLHSYLSDAVKGRLSLDESLVKQLHAGLWFHPVRHFAVLTGLSGSGKTQLALSYALALCGKQQIGQETVKVIPVQPGWFDPSPLLGYVNPIQQSSYRSSPFLELIIRASENPGQPYVAILDEMNLSHPEQYLAPILSAMETHGAIDLHQLAEGTSEIPRSVRYPANLAIVGTVNMDETTHGLSDKVLDRAFTLEFWKINVSDFPRWESSGLSTSLRDKAKHALEFLGETLAPVRLHFGWRTIDDVLNYLVFVTSLGTSDIRALDDALYAKVLPKLRGESSGRFDKALVAVRDFLKEHELWRCYEKVASMRTELVESGTARFWR